MTVGNEPLPAAEPAGGQPPVLAELAEAQAVECLEDSADRAAWWQEYLNTVASRMESETPLPGGGTDPAATGETGVALPAKESRVSNGEE